MYPHMSDLKAVNAVRTHRDQSAPPTVGGRPRSPRIGERFLRIRIAALVVSIRLRWERHAEPEAA